MAAIAAIMVAILAAIFNIVAKTHKKFRSAPMLQLQRKFVNNSAFSNRFCHYHIPHVGKTLHINFH
jgi:hypothetical protein